MKQQLIALQVLLIKETNRFARIWVQTILPPAINAGLYLMIFGNLIGQKIGSMSGFSYDVFIVPGIIIMSTITNAYSNTASSFFGSKFQGATEELFSSPMNNHTILLGYIGGGLFRGIAVAIAVFLVTSLFTPIHPTYIWLSIFTIIITSFLFSCLGFINGVLAKDFDGISIIPSFVLMPLTYLGGVFFAIDLLPSFWQALAKINPIFYIINQFRYSLIGISESNVILSISFLTIISGILYFICYMLLKNRISVIR